MRNKWYRTSLIIALIIGFVLLAFVFQNPISELGVNTDSLPEDAISPKPTFHWERVELDIGNIKAFINGTVKRAILSTRGQDICNITIQIGLRWKNETGSGTEWLEPIIIKDFWAKKGESRFICYYDLSEYYTIELSWGKPTEVDHVNMINPFKIRAFGFRRVWD